MSNVFTIKGDFQMGRLRQAFELQVPGADEAAATERLYNDLGSRHGVKRREITIKEIQATAPDKINPIRAKQAGI